MKRYPKQPELLELFEYQDNGDLKWKQPVGHKRGTGYIFVKIGSAAFALHRIIWMMHNGPIPPDRFLDHIDGNRSNNRITNLRLVTPRQSSSNRSIRTDNTSGRVGVYWYPRRKQWLAMIGIDGQLKHLGSFTKFEDAVEARVKAEDMYRDQFHPNHGRAK